MHVGTMTDSGQIIGWWFAVTVCIPHGMNEKRYGKIKSGDSNLKG